MSRLSIELTPEQHQRLKAMAALQGQSIKEYVLQRVLTPPSAMGSAADEALRQFEAFLIPRIEEAQMGGVVKKSVGSIFSEPRNNVAESSSAYDLSLSAVSDLNEIAKTTLTNWGKKQSAIYAGKLEKCFKKMTEDKLNPCTLSNRFRQVKSTKCAHHYAFYLQTKKELPIIIAILYEHIDMLSRLVLRISD